MEINMNNPEDMQSFELTTDEALDELHNEIVNVNRIVLAVVLVQILHVILHMVKARKGAGDAAE
jgi:hypothetical protein